ncbi:hypothetical protein PVAND_012784 [Polypedilum vanderplanki]|uniref:Odorant receptor n=1 Tax=Polypedilum vanderplanki TaxID=319348 RepID=A0A9J6CPI4_POLVA|nr:hypothetical protein PVAND_012784 [Polypedilum vanderplanki]
MDNKLIKGLLLFFGFDIDGQLKDYPKFNKVLKHWTRFVLVILIVANIQIWTFVCIHSTTDLFYLMTIHFGLTSFQALFKLISLRLNWNKMTSLYKNIKTFYSSNYGQRSLENTKFINFLNRFIAAFFTSIISAVLVTYLSESFQMLLDFIFETNTDLKNFIGFYWPIDNIYKYRWFIISYTTLLLLLNTSVAFMIDEFMLLTVGNLAICFDRLGDEVQNIIDESEDRAFHDTKEMLEKFIDKHNQLIEFSNDINSTFAIVSFLFIIPASIAICIIGFVMTTENSYENAISDGFGFLGMLAQLFIMFYASDKLKENSMKVSENIKSSKIYKVDRLLKKNILIIIQMANRPRKLNAMGFLAFDKENFVTIIKSAYSYLAVLQQIYR